MKKISLLLLLANPVWAISNIENERPNLPEQGLSGALNVSAKGKTGNQPEQSYDFGTKTIYRRGDNIFLVIAEKSYGTKDHQKNTDSSFLHSRWVHLLTEKWAVEGFAQRESDRFDNLTSRGLLGGGGRYVVAQQKDVYSLALGLGTFYEVEKQNLVSYQETNRLWRLNSYVSYKYQINEHVNVANTTYYQPALENSGDFRMLSDLGLNVDLTKRLGLQLNYRLTYDSDPAKNLDVTPPINNKKTNTEFKTTLSFRF